MKSYILVVGSSNTDMVVKSERLPVPGETILGGAFLMAAGGKGANQAVAAARLGGEVVFIGKVGADIFGQKTIELLRNERIDTGDVRVDSEHPSGVALITVDAQGENCIVVASGANGNLLPGDVAVEKIKQAAFVVMQLEIPLGTVEYVVAEAAAHGVPVILNPAPARALPDHLLKQVAILTPNQQEAEMLTGVRIDDWVSAERAAGALAGKGVKTVIITMGAEGALLLDQGKFERVAAPAVKPVDTTAAGDVFCGALAVAMVEGRSVKEAVSFACAAAALSVTRMGAQTSAPTRSAVDRFKEHH
jgi:ribokinase